MKQITKNFVDTEFMCPCCKKIKISYDLVDRLQIVRELIGVPITVTSGYRCKTQNKKVNGYEKSLHMQGLAADIKVRQDKMQDLKDICKKVFYDKGVGIYPNHVHVDMGKYQRFVGKY